MTIASALTALNTDIQNARTAITNKGGTVTVDGGSSQLATDIGTITTMNSDTLSITPTTSSQTFTPTFPKNCYSSVSCAAVTAAIDANIIASNIKSGVSILGVSGSLTPLIGQTKTVYLNTSTMRNYYPDTGYNGITRMIVFANNSSVSDITPTTSQQTFNIPSGYSGLGGFKVKAVDHNIDPNITGPNIKKDVTILGITGTYEGGGGGGGGSGYDLDVVVSCGFGGRYKLWVNGAVAFDSGGTMGYYGGYNIYYKNVENFMWEIIDGSWEPYAWDWADLTMGGNTMSLTPGQTYTLTGNATLYVYNQSCLTGDTLVTMYDGSTKRIDEVEVGDIVLSVDPKTNKLVPDTVVYSDKDEVKTDDHYDKWTFSDGYEVKTVKRHRFYNVEKQAFAYMDEWKPGEHTYTIDGNVVELLKHEVVNEEVRHYKITILKNHNYFANGILTGSRLTPQINIGKKDE